MFLNLELFWLNNKAVIEFGFHRIWRILQISEGVTHQGQTSPLMCRIFHILWKPNSIIAKYICKYCKIFWEKVGRENIIILEVILLANNSSIMQLVVTKLDNHRDSWCSLDMTLWGRVCLHYSYHFISFLTVNPVFLYM